MVLVAGHDHGTEDPSLSLAEPGMTVSDPTQRARVQQAGMGVLVWTVARPSLPLVRTVG
jgi:hypothetical protein